MKKVCLFVLFDVFLCYSVGYGAEIRILNREFIRGTGAPASELVNFSGYSGAARLVLINGDLVDKSVQRTSSSVIKINGNVIFNTSDFNQNVASLEKTINLVSGNNVIDVWLAGKPGGRITIQIFQVPPFLPPNPTFEEDRKASAVITPSQGGVIQTISSKGIETSLTIPPDALLGSDPISITVTPISGLQNDPTTGGFMAGVRLEPEGTLFIKPLILSLKVPVWADPKKLSVVCYPSNDGVFFAVPTRVVDTQNSVVNVSLFHFSYIIYGSDVIYSNKFADLMSLKGQYGYQYAIATAIYNKDMEYANTLAWSWFDNEILPALHNIGNTATTLSQTTSTMSATSELTKASNPTSTVSAAGSPCDTVIDFISKLEGAINPFEILNEVQKWYDFIHEFLGMDGRFKDEVYTKMFETIQKSDIACSIIEDKCSKKCFFNLLNKLEDLCVKAGDNVCNHNFFDLQRDFFHNTYCGGAEHTIPKTIDVAPPEIAMCPNTSEIFSADLKCSRGDTLIDVPVIWNILDTSLVGISNSTTQTVTATAFDPGPTSKTTVIKATEECGLSGIAIITVNDDDPYSVIISSETDDCTLYKGATVKLKATALDENSLPYSSQCPLKYNWTTSNPSVAIVEGNADTGEATVTIVADVGEAVITASVGQAIAFTSVEVGSQKVCDGSWDINKQGICGGVGSRWPSSPTLIDWNPRRFYWGKGKVEGTMFAIRTIDDTGLGGFWARRWGSNGVPLDNAIFISGKTGLINNVLVDGLGNALVFGIGTSGEIIVTRYEKGVGWTAPEEIAVQKEFVYTWRRNDVPEEPLRTSVGYSSNPRIAVNKYGVAIVVWPDGNTNVLARRYFPNGYPEQGWGPVMHVKTQNNFGDWIEEISIDDDGNAIMLTIEQNYYAGGEPTGYNPRVVASRYNINNNVWVETTVYVCPGRPDVINADFQMDDCGNGIMLVNTLENPSYKNNWNGNQYGVLSFRFDRVKGWDLNPMAVFNDRYFGYGMSNGLLRNSNSDTGALSVSGNGSAFALLDAPSEQGIGFPKVLYRYDPSNGWDGGTFVGYTGGMGWVDSNKSGSAVIAANDYCPDLRGTGWCRPRFFTYIPGIGLSSSKVYDGYINPSRIVLDDKGGAYTNVYNADGGNLKRYGIMLKK